MPTKSKVTAEKKAAPKPKAAKPKAPAKAQKKTTAKPKAKQTVTLTTLRAMARNLDVKGAVKMTKPELIHAIQVAEGHAACYSRIPDCGQMDCLFRPDCLPEMGVHV